MRVLMASAEMWPLAKAGGLGDMVAALSGAVAAQGDEVRCALPGYRRALTALPPGSREVHVAEAGTARVIRIEGPGLPVPVVLVSHPVFDREGIYDDPFTRQGYPDNPSRWALFCRALHATLGADGWAPDVVHGHDHQAAPLLGLLRWTPLPPGLSRRPGLVLTIHNLEYQGQVAPSWIPESGLPPALHRPGGALEFHGGVNLMKVAIEAADWITTVSPRYAAEIRTREFGAGLEDVLASRASRLVGILNGIDTRAWDPAVDPHLPFRYTHASFEDKSRNRTALCREVGLPQPDPSRLLVGWVGRLASQKGLDILLPALDAILESGVLMAVLGSGESRYEAALLDVERRRPGLSVRIGFDEGLAHRIEGGADAFLMPSRYEPCGLNQMYSLRYGTVPIVRGVGGLADTVIDADEDPERGNGFAFRDYRSQDLLGAVGRAVSAWGDRDRWRSLAARGMRGTFAWDEPARRYREVYQAAAAAGEDR
jgi:starch synthase